MFGESSIASQQISLPRRRDPRSDAMIGRPSTRRPRLKALWFHWSIRARHANFGRRDCRACGKPHGLFFRRLFQQRAAELALSDPKRSKFGSLAIRLQDIGRDISILPFFDSAGRKLEVSSGVEGDTPDGQARGWRVLPGNVFCRTGRVICGFCSHRLASNLGFHSCLGTIGSGFL